MTDTETRCERMRRLILEDALRSFGETGPPTDSLELVRAIGEFSVGVIVDEMAIKRGDDDYFKGIMDWATEQPYPEVRRALCTGVLDEELIGGLRAAALTYGYALAEEVFST